MTPTTTLARGYKLGKDYQADGWYGYINGGCYTNEQADALVDALLDAMEREVDKLLPAGCHWYPTLAEIQGPITATLEGIDLDDLLEEAAEAVAERFEEIEAE